MATVAPSHDGKWGSQLESEKRTRNSPAFATCTSPGFQAPFSTSPVLRRLAAHTPVSRRGDPRRGSALTLSISRACSDAAHLAQTLNSISSSTVGGARHSAAPGGADRKSSIYCLGLACTRRVAVAAVALEHLVVSRIPDGASVQLQAVPWVRYRPDEEEQGATTLQPLWLIPCTYHVSRGTYILWITSCRQISLPAPVVICLLGVGLCRRNRGLDLSHFGVVEGGVDVGILSDCHKELQHRLGLHRSAVGVVRRIDRVEPDSQVIGTTLERTISALWLPT
ncbi:hypothetical protein P154DRAFT_560994 [Amniculicola lignicola CBS 123094]|uniref:Uncharacterized protein n=1 Tax=Amniculicola lignicola CBS 123094 TaxID=1392246 RepID=A0A6A5WPN0_9PLEO|nr:hypothetical protein P154DRAFT_560994 [Amniculicola lignicola CBS 123094]